VKLSQILTYAAIAFVIWWVIQEPTNAAHLVHNIGTLLSSAAAGLSRFVASI
jgi:ABC-type glucose/galactose transport system permease subunit